MKVDKIGKEIKKSIISVLNEEEGFIKKIILFGSRARRDFEKESDWDLLIVVNRSLAPPERKGVWYKVYKAIHQHLPFVSIDVILKSAEQFEAEKHIVNTISNEAYLEGIEI